jgi:hypothetical protein
LPMLEKYGPPPLQISSKPKTATTYKWKKWLMGGKDLRLPIGAECAGLCKVQKKNSCMMGVTPNPCTSAPSLPFNCAIQIETTKQCFFLHKFC